MESERKFYKISLEIWPAQKKYLENARSLLLSQRKETKTNISDIFFTLEVEGELRLGTLFLQISDRPELKYRSFDIVTPDCIIDPFLSIEKIFLRYKPESTLKLYLFFKDLNEIDLIYKNSKTLYEPSNQSIFTKIKDELYCLTTCLILLLFFYYCFFADHK